MASFGSLLRNARDSKRISLAEVAEETRLAKRYLQALESETLSNLPGGTYNRSYLRTYATYLGLDATDLLHKYEQEEASQTAAGRLLTGPDALETIRQAAARKEVASGPVARAIELLSGTPGQVVGVVAVVTVLVILGSLGAAYFAALDQPVASSGFAETTASARVPAARGARSSAVPFTSSPVPLQPSAEIKAAGRPVSDVSAGESPAPGDEGDQGDQRVDDRAEVPSTAATDLAGRDVAGEPGDAPNGAGLVVAQSGVGTDVVNRQLVGQSDTFSVGARVVFWTRVVGGEYGDSVRHVWLHNGQTRGVVTLPVDGPSWRTQSRRTLASEAEGTWVVEARDPEGRVLARHEFQCES